MEKEQTLNEITDIFKDVLDVDDVVVTESTTSDDIDEWDSLTHIQLIVAIEKHFKIKFSSAEISNWKNVGEMINSIHHKVESQQAKPQEVAKEKMPEPQAFVKSSLKSMSNDQLPSYRRNHLAHFPNLQHGEHCFIGEGVSLTNVKMGDRVWVNKFATVFSSHNAVSIGSDCYIGPYVWVEGHAGLELGNSVHIAGPGTSLYTHSGMKMALNGEKLGNPGYDPQNETTHYFRVPIRIGNNVWIGPNCSISPGVVIQDFVVVMPNTLVKSGIIESYSVVSGNGQIEKNAEFVKSMLAKK